MALLIEGVYAAITGTPEDFAWDKSRDIYLKDDELELMFRIGGQSAGRRAEGTGGVTHSGLMQVLLIMHFRNQLTVVKAS
ncbi:hypothetical protein ACFLTZ_02415 [Chloroflexota bacterium]